MLEVQNNESTEQSRHDWVRVANKWQQKRLETLRSHKRRMRIHGNIQRQSKILSFAKVCFAIARIALMVWQLIQALECIVSQS